MAWNEPGNSNKDPWGNKGQRPDGPPDLDEALNKLKSKFSGLFGGASSNAGGGNSAGMGASFSLLAVIAVVVWALSGIYIVGPAEQAVVTRFGKVARIAEPGPHWLPRFMDKQYTVNVESVSEFPYRAQMLTRDENIVDVEIAVQYQIREPELFLFNIVDAEATLREATASALRSVVGQTNFEPVITTARNQIRDSVLLQLQELMDDYGSGLFIFDVNMQPARQPVPTQEAFDDAIKAREDLERSINQAEAYAGEVVPIAEGQALRILAEAEAYGSRVVLGAEGDVARFNNLLPEYQAAPEVTKQRLYLDTLEEVFRNSSKVFIDSDGGNNLLYLPLDKLLEGRVARSVAPPFKSGNGSNSLLSQSSTDFSQSNNRAPNSSLKGRTR